ncbi:hypothetical protein DFJ73DRAFT_758717 [Zopfochytrium polystomum]|nr:hypothetical protein DFJ73DRAFT_758717 [Zopfochytrium polystomum]
MAIHQSIFGQYSYGLPPKPSNWSAIDMTPWNYQGQRTDQSGSPLQNTATPRDNAKIATDAAVPSISHSLSSISKRKNFTIRFDPLVTAGDLSQYASLITDLQDDEKNLFIGSYTSAVLASTVYTSNPAPTESPSKLWISRMALASKFDVTPGRVFDMKTSASGAGRNQRTRRTSRSAHCAAENYGVNATGRQTRVAFECTDFQLTLVDLFRRDAATDLQSDVQMLLQPVLNYAPKFTQDGLKARIPWRIVDAQGNRNTLWIGSSVP